MLVKLTEVCGTEPLQPDASILCEKYLLIPNMLLW